MGDFSELGWAWLSCASPDWSFSVEHAPWDVVVTARVSLSLHHACITASEARHPRCFAQVGNTKRIAIRVSIMDSAARHGGVGRNSALRGAALVEMRPF